MQTYTYFIMQGSIPYTHDLNLGRWSETTENIANTSTRTHKHGYVSMQKQHSLGLIMALVFTH